MCSLVLWAELESTVKGVSIRENPAEENSCLKAEDEISKLAERLGYRVSLDQDPGYQNRRLPAMVPLTGPQHFATQKNSSHNWDS
jgi:hypothetical protein